jgi:inhibitor of KinA sporulation pathway (predicted exonuclease)
VGFPEVPMSARRPHRHAVVFDLEFTAWEGSLQRGWNRPGEFKELVQLGAVKVDAETVRPVAELNLLVRPRINPVLSDYLVRLTGVTNARMAHQGVDFAVAFRAFLDFVGDGEMLAFGRDDLIFEENMRLYALHMKMPRYRNVIPWFAENGVDLAGRHACDVAEAAGAAFAGRAHDALADAHAVTLGIATLVARGAPNLLLAPA